MADSTGNGNLVRRWLDAPKNSLSKMLIICFLVSVFSAVLVTGVALWKRPVIEQNREVNRQRNILAAAGLLSPDTSIEALFQNVEAKVVNLSKARFSSDISPTQVLSSASQQDPAQRTPIAKEQDVASIRYRPKYAVVYLVYEGSQLDSIVLPVYGYGLWSTLYGYLALASDANTIVGLRFYQQGETPGLGGEIDNPNWLKLWPGKRIYDETGTPVIEVSKGKADNSDSPYQVDGISGATMTGRGVTNLLHYWLGDDGFGPFLDSIRQR